MKSELISLMRCQLPNVGQSPCLPRDPSLPLRLLLGPLITHRIPFARAAEAYELVDQRPEETVQVILTYD